MCCNLQCHLSQYTAKTFVLMNKKCIFEHYREVLTIKNLLIGIIFVKNFFLLTFSEVPSVVLCQYYTKMRCSINSIPQQATVIFNASHCNRSLIFPGQLGAYFTLMLVCQAPNLTLKYQTRIELTDNLKHSSLLDCTIN